MHDSSSAAAAVRQGPLSICPPAPRPARRRGAGNGARLLIGQLLLALALVLTQAGALAHVVGHLADVPAAPASHDDSLRNDEGPADLFAVCAECLALSGIDLPLGDSGQHAAFSAARFATPACATTAPPPAVVLRPRCRAPPLAG